MLDNPVRQIWAILETEKLLYETVYFGKSGRKRGGGALLIAKGVLGCKLGCKLGCCFRPILAFPSNFVIFVYMAYICRICGVYVLWAKLDGRCVVGVIKK